MASSAVMSQAGGLAVTTSFRKEAPDVLDASSQSCFVGSPLSMTRLRQAAGPREAAAPSSPPAVSASLASLFPGNFFSQKNDVEADIGEEDDGDNVLSTSNELLDTVNNVISDVVDGQKYNKEMKRTKPRPMKRRSMVVCLAMGALQPYLSDVEKQMTRLGRTTSNSLAKTVHLVSQLSFGASRQLSITARQLSMTARQLSFGKSEADHYIPVAA